MKRSKISKLLFINWALLWFSVFTTQTMAQVEVDE